MKELEPKIQARPLKEFQNNSDEEGLLYASQRICMITNSDIMRDEEGIMYTSQPHDVSGCYHPPGP